MDRQKLACILGPMRLPFLLLTPACVSLGVGTAFRSSGTVNAFLVVFIVIGALCAHISVNAFNEYFDFKSGLDFRTHRTPFSGGSGTLPENPQNAHYALVTALVSLAIAGIIGISFLFMRGLALLPLGILGLLIVFVYTPWLTRNPFLCLIAPGLGFGPLMVMGTDFVLRGTYSLAAFIASIVPFFLVSNLLLLNQFPDVDADRSIGRRPFPIVFGKKTSTHLFGAFLALTYLSLVIGVYLNQLPVLSLLGLLTIAFAVPAYVGALRHLQNRNTLILSMALNVITNLTTPVLIAIGLFNG